MLELKFKVLAISDALSAMPSFAFMSFKGVAVLTASKMEFPGCIQLVIAPEKLANIKALPTKAGLNTFAPSPPKNSLATTIAKKQPRISIHIGRFGGITRASRRPVITAERSFTLISSLHIFLNKLSNPTQQRIETMILIKAGIEKR